MSPYDPSHVTEQHFRRIERALMLVLEGLCAVCGVVAFVAVVQAQWAWALLFAACCVAAFEAATGLDS